MPCYHCYMIFSTECGLSFQHLMFPSGKSTATMKTTITCIIIVVFLNTMCEFVSTEFYHKIARDRNCTLVMMCNSQETPVRSKIECYVISKGMAGTGAYYSPPTGICSMCLPPSTMTSFMACDKDMDYYSLGR